MVTASPPVFLMLAAAGPQGGMSWGFIAGAIIIWAVTQIISCIIIGAVSLAIMKRQTADLSRAVEKLADTLADHQAQLAKLDRDRVTCELRASRSYATADQLAQMLVEAAANHRQAMERFDGLDRSVRDRVSHVHKRVDELATATARIDERIGKEAKRV